MKAFEPELLALKRWQPHACKDVGSWLILQPASVASTDGLAMTI